MDKITVLQFQIKKYKANAQPYYVLLDHEGDNLNAFSAYDPDIDSYYAWLKEGIANFKPSTASIFE